VEVLVPCGARPDQLRKRPHIKRKKLRSRRPLSDWAARLVAFVLLSPLLAPAPAIARGPAPALSWVRGEGAESCITSVELAKKVESVLGGPVFVSASEAELVIEGYVNPKKGGGFEARLMVIDASGRWLGSRDLSIGLLDCSALDEALALVIAVTINPESGLAGGSILSPEMAATLDGLFSRDAAEVAASEQAAEASDANAIPSSASTRTAPKRERMGLESAAESGDIAPNPYHGSRAVETISSWYLSAAAALGAGLQPGIAPGFSVEVAYESNRVLRLGLRGSLSVPTEENTGTDLSRNASFKVLALTPLICPVSSSLGPHTISGCAGLMIGAIQARPSGFSVKNRKTSELILNPTFDFRLKWNVSEYISPRLGVAAILPLIQHAFNYRNTEGVTSELFRIRQIALGAELAVEVKY
jgi:hypothetical protein